MRRPPDRDRETYPPPMISEWRESSCDNSEKIPRQDRRFDTMRRAPVDIPRIVLLSVRNDFAFALTPRLLVSGRMKPVHLPGIHPDQRGARMNTFREALMIKVRKGARYEHQSRTTKPHQYRSICIYSDCQCTWCC